MVRNEPAYTALAIMMRLGYLLAEAAIKEAFLSAIQVRLFFEPVKSFENSHAI